MDVGVTMIKYIITMVSMDDKGCYMATLDNPPKQTYHMQRVLSSVLVFSCKLSCCCCEVILA